MPEAIQFNPTMQTSRRSFVLSISSTAVRDQIAVWIESQTVQIESRLTEKSAALTHHVKTSNKLVYPKLHQLIPSDRS